MDQGVDPGDAFAIPDLWRKSSLADFKDDATPLEREILQALGCLPLQIRWETMMTDCHGRFPEHGAPVFLVCKRS